MGIQALRSVLTSTLTRATRKTPFLTCGRMLGAEWFCDMIESFSHDLLVLLFFSLLLDLVSTSVDIVATLSRSKIQPKIRKVSLKVHKIDKKIFCTMFL